MCVCACFSSFLAHYISKEPCCRAMASPTGREEATLIIDLNFLTCEFYFYMANIFTLNQSGTINESITKINIES